MKFQENYETEWRQKVCLKFTVYLSIWESIDKYEKNKHNLLSLKVDKPDNNNQPTGMGNVKHEQKIFFLTSN